MGCNVRGTWYGALLSLLFRSLFNQEGIQTPSGYDCHSTSDAIQWTVTFRLAFL